MPATGRVLVITGMGTYRRAVREGPAGPKVRHEAPPATRRVVPLLVAALCAVLLVFHFALTAVYITETQTSGPVRSAVDGYFTTLFRQNWKLFAPTLSTDERVLRVRVAVTGQDGETLTSDWYDLGHVPDRSGPLSNLDYGRKSHMVANGFRNFENAEWDLRKEAGQPSADPTVLAGDPSSPQWLVARYERDADFLIRLAVDAVEPVESRPITAVQLEQLILEAPSYERRTSPAKVSYQRRLPWWGVPA